MLVTLTRDFFVLVCCCVISIAWASPYVNHLFPLFSKIFFRVFFARDPAADGRRAVVNQGRMPEICNIYILSVSVDKMPIICNDIGSR